MYWRFLPPSSGIFEDSLEYTGEPSRVVSTGGWIPFYTHKYEAVGANNIE